MANGKNGNGNGTNQPKRRTQPKRNGNSGGGNNLSATALSYSAASSNVRPIQNGITKLSGSDFLQVATVRSGVSGAGKIIASFPVSPSAYPGTRLTQLANLWEFFKFDKFHVRWVPAVPTTLACQFVFYVDLDPSDDPTVITDESALIRQAVAQTGAQQWNFHVPKRIPMAMRSDRQFYFTGADKQNARFSQQGKGYLIQITNPINFNGELLAGDLQAGSLFIDWTVSFNTPQINPEPVVSATTTLLPFAPSDTVPVPLVPNPPNGTTQYVLSGLVPGHAYAYALSARIPNLDEASLVDAPLDQVKPGTRLDLNREFAFLNVSAAPTNGFTTFLATSTTRTVRIGATGLTSTPVNLMLSDLNSTSTLTEAYSCVALLLDE
jgi:hypothetical protein